jgi:hypothetical protein
MKTDARSHPMDAGFFGSYAVVQMADQPTPLIQQPNIGALTGCNSGQRWRVAYGIRARP